MTRLAPKAPLIHKENASCDTTPGAGFSEHDDDARPRVISMSIWRNVVQLLLTLSPTTVALKVSQRPLRRSARAFSECSQGSDINVPRFLRAAKAYCDLVSRFGRFAVPSAGEISRCIVKVEQAAAQLAKNGTKGNSMKALLQEIMKG